MAAIALSACAQLSTNVDVGEGTAAYVRQDAQPYAALYLPYAQMAALAYKTENGSCPLSNGSLSSAWTCKFARPDFKVCSPGRDCVPGLGFHV